MGLRYGGTDLFSRCISYISEDRLGLRRRSWWGGGGSDRSFERGLRGILGAFWVDTFLEGWCLDG